VMTPVMVWGSAAAVSAAAIERVSNAVFMSGFL
jgi:hypothetical protein